MNFTEYMSQVLFLLRGRLDRLIYLGLFFLFGSFLDLIGLSLVGAYVAMILDVQEQQSQIVDFLGAFGLLVETTQHQVYYGIILLIIFSLKCAFAIFVNYVIVNFSQIEQARIRSMLMGRYQKMPYIVYLNRNSSEYIRNIQTLVVQYTDNVLMPALRATSDIIVSIAIVLFLFLSDISSMALLIGLLIVMIGSYDRIFRRRLVQCGREANHAANSLIRCIAEGINGIDEIRILGKENFFYTRVKTEAEKYAHAQARAKIIATSSRFLMELIAVSFIILLVLIALMNQGDINAIMPTIAVFGVASLRLLPAANGFSSALAQIRFGKDAVSVLYHDLSDTAPTSTNVVFSNRAVNGELECRSDFLSYRMTGVSFSYPGGSNFAIDKLNFYVEQGSSIGIIGASGSGKSTFVKLLLGLLRPSSGEVHYNNAALDDLNKDLWLGSLAYIPQEPLLLDDTLRRNIALGESDENIDEDRLNLAIDKSSLRVFVNQLPAGTDTKVGESGARLSGGQKQRVALARAFYYDKQILVMDESTSSLDIETEHQIVDEISSFRGKATFIIVAHRHSTIKHCDLIYEMKDGKFIAMGPPSKLLKK